jgi:SAM-dependent methyltransferase
MGNVRADGPAKSLLERVLRRFAWTRPLVLWFYRLWSPTPSESARAFQLGNWTWSDRYPELFAFVAQHIGTNVGRVLSFGCSTGEEVFTLRKYFPDAEIKGIDVNILNIAKCRARLTANPDDRIQFERTSDCESQPKDHFDAIFCMAVLRDLRLDGKSPSSSTAIFEFAEFERVVRSMFQCLKPGGLLIVAMSNFRVGDTAFANELQPIWQARPGPPFVFTPIYDARNALVDTPHYPDVVFKKASVPLELDRIR